MSLKDKVAIRIFPFILDLITFVSRKMIKQILLICFHRAESTLGTALHVQPWSLKKLEGWNGIFGWDKRWQRWLLPPAMGGRQLALQSTDFIPLSLRHQQRLLYRGTWLRQLLFQAEEIDWWGKMQFVIDQNVVMSTWLYSYISTFVYLYKTQKETMAHILIRP